MYIYPLELIVIKQNQILKTKINKMKVTLRFLLAAIVGVIWYLTFAYLPYWTVDGAGSGFTMMWTAATLVDFSINPLAVMILFPLIILSILFNWKQTLLYMTSAYALNMLYQLLKAGGSPDYQLCYGFYVHAILMLVIPFIIYGGLLSYSEQKSEIPKEIITDANSVQPITDMENTIEKSEKKNDSFSLADELSKYAKLKDDGHITQQEFDNKKKELLG